MEEAGQDNKTTIAVAARTSDASLEPLTAAAAVSTNFTFTCNVQATVISTATETSSQLESATSSYHQPPAENLDSASPVEPAKEVTPPQPCGQEPQTAAEPEASKAAAPPSEDTGPNEVDAALPLRVQAEPEITEQEPATTVLEQDEAGGSPKICDEVSDSDVPNLRTVQEAAEYWFESSVFEEYFQALRFRVGKGIRESEFWIHTSVLRERADAFYDKLIDENLLHNISDEDQRQEAILTSCAKSTFRLFASWLYTGQIIALPLSCRDHPEDFEPENMRRMVAGSKISVDQVHDIDLVRLYKFACDEKIQDVANLVVTTLFVQNDQNGKTASRGAISFLVDNVSRGDPIHMQIVYECCRRMTSRNVVASLGDFPREYGQNVLKEILKQREKPEGPKLSKNQQKKEHRRQVCEAHAHRTMAEATACQKELVDRTGRKILNSSTHDLYGGVLTVTVGPERLLFTVHKGLVCKHSDYFAGAFPISWSVFKEAQESKVDLHEETVRDFSLFMNWLYEQKLCLPRAGDYSDLDDYQDEIEFILETVSPKENAPASASKDSVADALNTVQNQDAKPALDSPSEAGSEASDDEDSDDDDEEFGGGLALHPRQQSMLVDLFAFADRRGVEKLRNDIMTLLARTREDGWRLLSLHHELVDKIYSSLPSSSAMCGFVVDEAVWCWSTNPMDTDALESYPKEFYAAFIKAVLKHDRDITCLNTPWRTNLCKYHNHKTEFDKVNCREALQTWYTALEVRSQDEYIAKYGAFAKKYFERG
ncbi:hypothetical protein CB0940_12153 [Cercospora beticola]|uniref:BTB domain-containing protein n=1 Tax=Cercospora beticola TaxID=122368 RepID=A0A2G5GIE9_CERBT|nr:hypothetical protein CB0940_12153 [Cercospora beticola]PIA80056.1 hypothetical protein CB0940_12153 [Cercospora beticola]WPB07654.1 hypothetical protein RHO25_012315 [Cercospora beticola]CAK1356543.1 unnamed protein product [Cercospora beticola]